MSEPSDENPIVHDCATHGTRRLSECRKQGKNKSGSQRYKCSICSKEISKRFYENHREEVKERIRKWQRENPEKKRESHRKNFEKYREKYSIAQREHRKRYDQKNPDKAKERKKRYRLKSYTKLNSSYIRELLSKGTPLRGRDFPDGVVDLKRVLIQIKRARLERENETKDK